MQFGGMRIPGNIGAMIGKFLGSGGGAHSRSVHMEMDEEISNILLRKIIESTRIYPSSRFPVLVCSELQLNNLQGRQFQFQCCRFLESSFPLLWSQNFANTV